MRLGGMLGDFARGPVARDWPADIAQGIALHRAIDSFTDQHAAVLDAKALFDKPFRRYSGILLDVWFDHLLARRFEQFAAQPLDTFSRDLNALLATHAADLPPALQRFAIYMQRHGLPAAYADRGTLAAVLAGIGSRLRHANPLADGLAAIGAHEFALDEAFAGFFPDLVQFAHEWRAKAGLP